MDAVVAPPAAVSALAAGVWDPGRNSFLPSAWAPLPRMAVRRIVEGLAAYRALWNQFGRVEIGRARVCARRRRRQVVISRLVVRRNPPGGLVATAGTSPTPLTCAGVWFEGFTPPLLLVRRLGSLPLLLP